MDYLRSKEDQKMMNDILAQKGLNKVDLKTEYEKIKQV